jgi:hypothetical protein
VCVNASRGALRSPPARQHHHRLLNHRLRHRLQLPSFTRNSLFTELRLSGHLSPVPLVMTPAATGPSPLIAGAPIDFNDFSDEEFGPNSLFDFSNSPDTLQSLGSLGAGDPKAFLSPQELSTGTLPDSPNAFYHDSSSESASSKRAGSSTSSKTPVTTTDVTMDEDPVKMEWETPDYSSFADEDAAFGYGHDAGPSSLDGLYCFNQDDSFINPNFDFDSASNSPDTTNGVQLTVASPELPAFNAHSPPPPESTQDQVKKLNKGKAHKKAASVCGTLHISHPVHQY